MTSAGNCPFCNDPLVEIESVDDGNDNTISVYVVCDACGAKGPEQPNTERAVEAWNRAALRSSSDPDAVRALEEMADAIDEARYQHPDHPRERPRPFSEADRHDREYALRLARAALAAHRHTPAGSGGPVVTREIINKGADEVVTRVCEYDDRTSPDDYPEHLLILPSELHAEIVRFAEDLGILLTEKRPPSNQEGGK